MMRPTGAFGRVLVATVLGTLATMAAAQEPVFEIENESVAVGATELAIVPGLDPDYSHWGTT